MDSDSDSRAGTSPGKRGDEFISSVFWLDFIILPALLHPSVNTATPMISLLITSPLRHP